VQIPAERAVLPTGPYLLFVNRKTADGPVPSVAKDVTVKPALNVVYAEPMTPPPAATFVPIGGGPLAAKPPVDLDGAGAVAVDPDVAFHEIAELSLTGHSHSAAASGHEDHERGGVPWQALPASAALAVASVLLMRATGRRSAVAS